MNEFPTRLGIRLNGYDYSSSGYYFITICVNGKQKLLCDVEGDAHPGVPSVNLTEIGIMVMQHVENISSVYNNIVIDKYAIMPNHVHMIMIIVNGTPGCASPTKSVLSNAINAFKSLTSKQFGEPLWQRSYHDHIIRCENEYKSIWRYIDENPLGGMRIYTMISNADSSKILQ